jgi:hypothetical protein
MGPHAPVLDSYAESVYDGLHLVATLSARGCLAPERIAAATADVLDVRRTRQVHLARADGLELSVVPGVA